MRFTSCFIENFGTLHDFQLDFNEHLTTLQAPNGAGKTTLADFIRCMLYGMPRKGKDLQRDLRTKYQPWQGGTYGGQLSFDYQGASYRIERTFGSGPSSDTLVIYAQASGLPTDEFGKEPGWALFHVDADSFERTLYSPQKKSSDLLVSPALQAQLAEGNPDQSDASDYERAYSQLRKARAALASYRGETGELYEVSAQVTQLSQQLEQARADFVQIEAEEKKALDCDAELQRIKTMQADLDMQIGVLNASINMASTAPGHYGGVSAEKPQHTGRVPLVAGGLCLVAAVALWVCFFTSIWGFRGIILVSAALTVCGIACLIAGIIRWRKSQSGAASRQNQEPSAAASNYADPVQTLDSLQYQKHNLDSAYEKVLAQRASALERKRFLQERAADRAQLEHELHAAQNQRKEILRNISTLDATLSYLQQAQEQLNAHYAGRLEQNFTQYTGRLLQHTGLEVALSASYEPVVFHQGFQHESGYLSAGYKDLLQLCLRVALVDALFEEELSPLILDDPFVNLDDTLIEQGFALLQDLAAQHQIVYLTCSSARLP